MLRTQGRGARPIALGLTLLLAGAGFLAYRSDAASGGSDKAGLVAAPTDLRRPARPVPPRPGRPGPTTGLGRPVPPRAPPPRPRPPPAPTPPPATTPANVGTAAPAGSRVLGSADVVSGTQTYTCAA